MTELLDTSEIVITDSESPVSFQTAGGGHWDVWDRYIAIDGKNAFHIGNICGTCSFFFERLHGANQSFNIDAIVEQLNAGVAGLSHDLTEKVQRIIPNGKYNVLLLRVVPKLIRPLDPDDYFAKEQTDLWGVEPFWGLPHHPKTEYYRLSSRLLQD